MSRPRWPVPATLVCGALTAAYLLAAAITAALRGAQ